ncbi:MAG: Transcription factor WhiB [Frankiaceae bacterium]|nr:Transcription factor WhiB [Frankiaceae bacterium]
MTTTDQTGCRPTLTNGHDEPYTSWVRRARRAGHVGTFADVERADEAVAICGMCRVRRQCRRWALVNAVDGVAGGMTAQDRAAWRREASIPEPTVSVEGFLLAGGRTCRQDVGAWPLRGDPGRGRAVDRRRVHGTRDRTAPRRDAELDDRRADLLRQPRQRAPSGSRERDGVGEHSVSPDERERLALGEQGSSDLAQRLVDVGDRAPRLRPSGTGDTPTASVRGSVPARNVPRTPRRREPRRRGWRPPSGAPHRLPVASWSRGRSSSGRSRAA